MTTEHVAPTVFVVDDDPAVRESVSALVSSAGYRAETFESAESFLENFECTRPGCVVADIRMLEMSGLDLQDRLLSENCPTPIIMISAYANAPLAVMAMRRGAVDVLEKPYSNTELLNNIRTALELDTKRRATLTELRELKARLNSLTDDERKVLDAMSAGKANKVIARELSIGLRTVEARRHNIFKKMKADSLAELVTMMVALRDDHG